MGSKSVRDRKGGPGSSRSAAGNVVEDSTVTAVLLVVTWAYWPDGWDGSSSQWVAVGACFAHLLKRHVPVVPVLVAGCAAAVSSALWPMVYLIWWLVRTRRWVLAALLTVLPFVLAVYGRVGGSNEFGVFVEPRPIGPVVLAIAAAVLGAWMAERHRTQQLVTEKLALVEQSRESLEHEIRTEERVQLATELHDVVAHRLSIIALHAAVLSRRPTSDHELTQRLTMLESNAVLGVRELGDVLLALRTRDGWIDGPTELQVADLVGEAESTGLRVRTVDDFDGSRHTSAQLLTIGRVLREGLTNARKYASDSTVTVRVASAAGRTTVEIDNEFDDRSVESGTGTGLGLIGLQERARLVGGQVHGHAIDNHYVLSASVPFGDDQERAAR